MSKTGTTPYDVAEHLRTPEEMAAYLEASIEESQGDIAFIEKALRDVARAQEISLSSKELGQSSKEIDSVLVGDSNLTFKAVLGIIDALSLKLSITAMPTE